MPDYVLLYRGGRTPESDEERAMVMKAWDGWMHELGPKLKDGGNPFTPGVASTISADGTVQQGAGDAGGYSIVAADSLDEATRLAKSSPALQGGGSVEVYETFEAM